MDVLTAHANHILSRISRVDIWAIRPETLDALITFALGSAMKNVQLDQGTFSTWEAAKPSTLGTGQSRVAIIPVQGILTSDGPSWLGSSYEGIADAAEQAAADPSVKRIVLKVDSPGGEVSGVPETADILGQAAKAKPMSAMVEGQSCSAAYWLTSKAREIVITPSGEVGSIGVMMRHMDVSQALKDSGISVTELQSGPYKTEWSRFKPLSDDAKTHMQGRMDNKYKEFMDAIKTGRGNRLPAQTLENQFGGGRTFTALEAKNNGMVDAIHSRRDFYKGLVPSVEEAVTPRFGLMSALEVTAAKLRGV